MTNTPTNSTIANIETAALETVAGGCGKCNCKNNTTIVNNYGPRWGGPPPGYSGRGWGGGMSVSTTTSIG